MDIQKKNENKYDWEKNDLSNEFALLWKIIEYVEKNEFTKKNELFYIDNEVKQEMFNNDVLYNIKKN